MAESIKIGILQHSVGSLAFGSIHSDIIPDAPAAGGPPAAGAGTTGGAL